MIEALKPILTARLTQILVRLLAVFLVARVGYSQSQAEATLGCIAELLVALGLFLADFLIHWARNRMNGQKGQGNAGNGLPLLLLLLLPLAGGCTLSAQYVAADRLTYRAVEPRLRIYASTQPAPEQQQVDDLIVSWDRRLRAAEGVQP